MDAAFCWQSKEAREKAAASIWALGCWSGTIASAGLIGSITVAARHCRFICADPALLEQWTALYPDIPTDDRRVVYADTAAEARSALENGAEVITAENLPEMLALVKTYRK